NYNFTKNNNTKIEMAFDKTRDRVSTLIGGVPVYDVDDLEEKIDDIQVAILTVPAKEAQKITDRLVAKGVIGILKFMSARITVLDYVSVHHIDLSLEL